MDVAQDADKGHTTQSNKRQCKNRLLKMNKHLESIHESKTLWNDKNILIENIEQQIGREVAKLNKKLKEKVIQPVKAAMVAGYLDATAIAQFHKVCATAAEFENEAFFITNKLMAARKYIAKNGGFWRQEVPEVADLQKLTFNERKAMVKTWRDGRRFLRVWVRLFNNSREDWGSLRIKLNRNLKDCLRVVFIQHKEQIFKDKEGNVN